LLTSAAFVKFAVKDHITPIAATESAFDRVMRTKTIRCGYVVYAPTIIRDPNTKQLSGIMHDVIEGIAQRLELKVDWVEEATWATYMEGLYTNRYDAVCAAAWANNLGEWPKSETVGPVFYSGITIWVRPDDHRFDNNLALINDAGVTIASIDGTIPGRIAATDFPKAKILSLPQSGDHSFNLLNVANGKADVTMVENYTGNEYLANNPSALRNITPQSPVRIYPNVFLVGKGEYKLQTMLQMVLNDMQNNGEIDKIIARYEKYPGSFYRAIKPYQAK
jgi:ABC-type amino acid transport substrate-binding protein